MAILPMALLQQHDARRNIVIEPAARRHAAIEARGHSELRAFRTGGVLNCGRNEGVKTHRLVCLSVWLCVSDRHFYPFYPSTSTDFDETWSEGPYSDLVWPRA